MKYLRALLLFLLPSAITKHFVGGTIGFSFVIVDNLCMAKGSKIGHFNYINCPLLSMGNRSTIHLLNIIKGYFDIDMKEGANLFRQNVIRRFNKKNNYKKAEVNLRKDCWIGVNHFFDVTDSLTIGENTIIAGKNTECWTHGFLIGKNKKVRIDAPIYIGSHCYIGSRCMILAGTTISDNITIGAATTVTGDLNKQGVYVGQGIRYMPFDADKKIDDLHNPIAHIQDTDIYKKETNRKK